jgi:hypothetical protein
MNNMLDDDEQIVFKKKETKNPEDLALDQPMQFKDLFKKRGRVPATMPPPDLIIPKDEELEDLDCDDQEEKSCDDTMDDDFHIKFGGSSLDFSQKNKRMIDGNFNPKHPELYKKALDPHNGEEDDASVSNEMSSSQSSQDSEGKKKGSNEAQKSSS